MLCVSFVKNVCIICTYKNKKKTFNICRRSGAKYCGCQMAGSGQLSQYRYYSQQPFCLLYTANIRNQYTNITGHNQEMSGLSCSYHSLYSLDLTISSLYSLALTIQSLLSRSYNKQSLLSSSYYIVSTLQILQ